MLKLHIAYTNIILIIFFLFSILAISCSSNQREEIMERYPSGTKSIVGVYEGSGSNEKFIERKYYQKNGKLGRIENLIEDSTTSYLDLYPETKTSDGLKNFLEGFWFTIEKISHDRFNVYESYSMWFDNEKKRFDNYKLQRSVNISICSDTEDVMDVSYYIVGDIEYLDDLYISDRNLSFFMERLNYESWVEFTDYFHLDPFYFTFNLFAELAKKEFEIDQNSLLGKYATLNRIEIPNNSIGESFKPKYGTQAELNDEAWSYLYSKGIGPIGVTKNYIMTKGTMPRSCEELKNYFR